MSARCTVTHVGSFGNRIEPPYETTFFAAFASAMDWVGRPGLPATECRSLNPTLELRCLETGTLYRIKPKRARGQGRDQ